MKIKLYKVDVYQALRADEKGIRWFSSIPNDSCYYKHEILGEVIVDLPSCISYDKSTNIFSYNGHDCELVTFIDDSAWLISSEGFIKVAK